MTAEDIRNKRITGDMRDVAFFMREIAAQLADLNQHLKLVDESVFGSPKEIKNDTSKRVNKS